LKRTAAALFMCAVMVMVVAVPLASGGEYIIVKGEKGPRNSAVTWSYVPDDYGDWKATIDNHGLRWMVVDVYDNSSGVPEEIWHERIRFAAVEAYPMGIAYSGLVSMAMRHTYEITVTPNGLRDSYAMVSDTFTKNEPPIAILSTSMDYMVVTADGTMSSDPDGSIDDYSWNWGDGSSQSGMDMIATHTYATPGDYWVTLTVTDNLGATDDATEMVTAAEKPNEPPVAAFTYDQKDLTVKVNGTTSTDSDGTVVSWDWDFAGEASASGPTATYTFMTEGLKAVTLTVADDDGATDTETKMITVTMPADDPPTAAFTWIANELVVDFDASGSDDDYGIDSWDWEFGDGSTGSGEMTTHTYAKDGTYKVNLTVTDTASQTGSVSHDVSVASKKNPIADFSVSADWLDVTVDATASRDPDGSVVAWAWDFGDTTTGAGEITTHSYAMADTYTITLTVTDDDGLTGSLSKDVTVEEEPNLPPVAAFTASADGNRLGTFDGSASYDPDGTVQAWAWNFGDTTTGTGKTTTHLYAADGTYDVTLTVTDNEGATASLTKQLVVKFNNPPIASFTVQKTYLDVLVNGAGSTDDGSIVSYAWTFGDGVSGTGVSKTHTYASGGTYTITLVVTDNGGKTGTTSQQVTVAPNPPPVAVIALVSQTDLTVSVSGSDSTDDSAIDSYAWSFDDGGTESTMDATHTYAMAGTYTITLLVTDDYGLTDTETLDVTVSLPAPVYEKTYRVYDVGQEPWGEWWTNLEWGRIPYYGTDYVISSTPGANTLLFLPSRSVKYGYQGLIYTPYRYNIDASNVSALTTDSPEFMPVLGSSTAADPQASMDIYFQYLDNAWWASYWLPTWNWEEDWPGDTWFPGFNDGYFLGTTLSVTMNRAAAEKWLGMPTTATPSTWWTANKATYKDSWLDWVLNEGNVRLDIYCGYEWDYVDYGLFMDLTVDGSGDVVLSIGHINYGYEILMTRWLDEKDISTHQPWMEDFSMQVTMDSSMGDLNMDAVAQYSMHANKANGTADGAAWTFEPLRVDYITKTGHPSEYTPYKPLFYQSWNSGDVWFSQPVPYEATPSRMNLGEHDTLIIQMPTGSAIGYMGAGVETSVYDEIQSTGDPSGFDPITVWGDVQLGYSVTNPAAPIDLTPMWDSATKTLTIAGPATFDNPRSGGLLYHGAPWIEFNVIPGAAKAAAIEPSSSVVVEGGEAATTSSLAVLSCIALIAIGALAAVAVAGRSEEA